MKKLLFILLLILSTSVFATTRSDAVRIYKKITSANGFVVYPDLKFSNSNQINARTDMFYITINRGMLNATNIDELALVIGHELAHSKLWHLKSTHQNEYAADRLGWFFASKAGYNVCRGKNLFKKFPQRGSTTHPHPKDRYNRLPRC